VCMYVCVCVCECLCVSVWCVCVVGWYKPVCTRVEFVYVRLSVGVCPQVCVFVFRGVRVPVCTYVSGCVSLSVSALSLSMFVSLCLSLAWRVFNNIDEHSHRKNPVRCATRDIH